MYFSVTTLTATYIILKSKVRYHRDLHGVLNICNVWLSLKTLCSKVMASSSYLPWLPSTLPDELSTDIRNSSRFLSRQRVSTFNNSFCKITDSSLFSPKELLSFLAYFCTRGTWLAAHCLACTRDTASHYAITCNLHYCGYSILQSSGVLVAVAALTC